MTERKNLCAMVPIELHNQVTEAREQLGQTTNEYITAALTEYFKMKQNGGKTIMTNNRTMAFQISEELFQRIKAHLERETARTGRKLTQREFVLNLIEAALDEAEQALVGQRTGRVRGIPQKQRNNRINRENSPAGYPKGWDALPGCFAF